MLFGLDGEAPSAAVARGRGVLSVFANLECLFPLRTERVDVVVYIQATEHIVDLDLFVAELGRVTGPGGAIVATPNLASWMNVGAPFLGPRALSRSTSGRWQIGNRFPRRYRTRFVWDYRLHEHILTLRGLQDLFDV